MLRVLQGTLAYQHLAKRFSNQTRESHHEEVADSISRDAARTFPGLIEFADNVKLDELWRVLMAYSLYDPEVGYCQVRCALRDICGICLAEWWIVLCCTQGMNFVAGLLLCYLEEGLAFSGLVYMMESCGMRRNYLPTMEGTALRLYQLQKLVQELLPRLAGHLDDNAVEITLFATPWLLACFASDFPLNFSARVVDGLLSEESPAPFFRACIALLREAEPELLNLKDFEEQARNLICKEWALAKRMNGSMSLPCSSPHHAGKISESESQIVERR